MTLLEAILRRERAVVAAALALLLGLCWFYLWQGAGMGMSALAMTRAALFPHRLPEVAGSIQTAKIIAAALIEGFTFFALFICWGQKF